MPNEQKQIFQQKMGERGEKPVQQPVISFQYNPPPPRPQTKTLDPQPYFPIFAQNLAYPPQFGYPYQYGPYGGSQMAMPPIIKNIQINTEGPNDDHQKLFVINQDYLPSKPFVPSFNSLGERLNIYNFIRASIFNNSDGSDIGLSGNSDKSLLSFIKFGDLNPYNSYRYSHNPYLGLPDGYLIYRSCYPIRLNTSSGSTMCAKDSTAINVRLYKMLEGSFLVNRLNPTLYHQYDEWRDVAYYEYIRESIIKKKVCPNFITLYGWFIVEKTNVDYDRINILKNSSRQLTTEPLYNTVKNTPQQGTVTLQSVTNGQIISSTSTSISYRNNDNQVIEVNPRAYRGKSLILLTESPTYTIFEWASKTYQTMGNVKEMINRGVHTEKEWFNVLFQIMVSLHVMQLHKFFIRNFKLENNVFVKDLTMRGQVTNYWKYKVDDVDFYIPNLGYLVMIDTNFKDVLPGNVSGVFGVNTTNSKKVDGRFITSDTNILSDSQINDAVFDMFMKALDVNEYGQDFISAGGCRPPPEVISLMEKITVEAASDNDKNIKKYIIKYMHMFMHNRIGTYLREGEVANIRRDDTREFKRGQLLVNEDGFVSYKFVMFLETNNGTSKILSKLEPNDDDLIESTVPVASLINYSRAENIIQTFKPNEANMNEEDLLEIYVTGK